MGFLIIGYGSAGKRHKQTLVKTFGFDPKSIITVDPNPRAGADYESHWDAMIEYSGFDTIVIASPPSEHLVQIEAALEYGANVLCEKPLCALGQIKEANALCLHPDIHKVMVAYNYRFNPSLEDSAFVPKNAARNFYFLRCSQYRENPPQWGFLLDHLSHDLDIISYKSGSPMTVEHSEHHASRESEGWIVSGKTGECKFEINEIISLVDKIPRRAILATPIGWTSISSNPIMFDNMWRAYLDNAELGIPQNPGFKDALGIQILLEEVSQCQI